MQQVLNPHFKYNEKAYIESCYSSNGRNKCLLKAHIMYHNM